MVLTQDALREHVLEAAQRLFYERGVQAVGMDEVRGEAGVSLRRLYQLFPSKGELVQAYLRWRDRRWLDSLETHVSVVPGEPSERVLAVFDWLRQWFEEPDFRGCAFVNAFGELGAVLPEVASIARRHKEAFASYVTDLVRAAGGPDALGEHVFLLAEGAIVTAAITGSAEPAAQAKSAAEALLRQASG